MKVEKDGIVKDVDSFLTADYITAGWKVTKKKSIEENVENKDKKNENNKI